MTPGDAAPTGGPRPDPAAGERRPGRFSRLLVSDRAPGPGSTDPGSGAPAWVTHPASRILLIGVLFVGIQVIGGITSDVVATFSGALGDAGSQLAQAVVAAAVALAAYGLLVRFLERRPAVEVAPAPAPRDLARGLLWGTVLFSATIGTIALAGGYRVSGTGSLGGVVTLLGFAVYSGVLEELVFRAVLFRIAEELVGTWAALAVSAATFGLLHLTNPDATWWGATAVMIEAGVLLAATYVLTRRLWAPIGLHIAWNFTQGGVFGVEISGSGVGGDGLLRGELSGPTALAGGRFGAEASVFAVGFCLALALVMLVIARRRGRIRPPRWRRRPARSAATGD